MTRKLLTLYFITVIFWDYLTGGIASLFQLAIEYCDRYKVVFFNYLHTRHLPLVFNFSLFNGHHGGYCLATRGNFCTRSSR